MIKILFVASSNQNILDIPIEIKRLLENKTNRNSRMKYVASDGSEDLE